MFICDRAMLFWWGVVCFVLGIIAYEIFLFIKKRQKKKEEKEFGHGLIIIKEDRDDRPDPRLIKA